MRGGLRATLSRRRQEYHLHIYSYAETKPIGGCVSIRTLLVRVNSNSQTKKVKGEIEVIGLQYPLWRF